jgi:hypothetical protein
VKCYFVEARECLVARVDVIDREVGVDENVADHHPVAIEVSQLHGDGVVFSQEDPTMGRPTQGWDGIDLGLYGDVYRPPFLRQTLLAYGHSAQVQGKGEQETPDAVRPDAVTAFPALLRHRIGFAKVDRIGRESIEQLRCRLVGCLVRAVDGQLRLVDESTRGATTQQG